MNLRKNPFRYDKGILILSIKSALSHSDLLENFAIKKIMYAGWLPNLCKRPSLSSEYVVVKGQLVTGMRFPLFMRLITRVIYKYHSSNLVMDPICNYGNN